MRTVSILGILLSVICSIAGGAPIQNKGEALPARTVDVIVDIENRAVVNLFGGDAEAARDYVTNILFAVSIIFSQDLNITLSVRELNVWETPAPFEIPASEEPDTPDVLQAYREYVLAERADQLPCLFQLFSGNLPSYSSASLAYASQACNGTSMQRLFGTTTFPAGPGSIDVILSARGLGRNLGAASNTTDPSVMAAVINGSTPLLFLPESITAIANRLAVGDCWVPVVVEGEGEEPVEICNDGIDNDENGFTDCDDFACAESEYCIGETSCGDGIDNDENGFTDCDDFACAESQFCIGETNCNDGIDNDENGFTDCDDFACAESPECAEGEGQSDGEGVVDGEGGETSCNDGIDNDENGFTDCDDFACAESQFCTGESNCNDGIDNDENGFADCDDFACAESPDCTGETNCNDGIDNDENGFTDCDDFACAESPVCTETEGSVDGEGTADGEGDPQPEYQSADINIDFVINLSELLRVVQLYNSQGLYCGDANSEDGYVPGSNINFLDCPPHTSDFDPQNWVITLSELLQLIQLYNADGYEPCEAPEAFCPVLP